MSADLWGTANSVVVPNCNYCNAEVGNSSGSTKGGGGDDDSAVPLPPPPPPRMVLVIIVFFDASSLLPTVVTIDCGILPPLGSDTRCV